MSNLIALYPQIQFLHLKKSIQIFNCNRSQLFANYVSQKKSIPFHLGVELACINLLPAFLSSFRVYRLSIDSSYLLDDIGIYSLLFKNQNFGLLQITFCLFLLVLFISTNVFFVLTFTLSPFPLWIIKENIRHLSLDIIKACHVTFSDYSFTCIQKYFH